MTDKASINISRIPKCVRLPNGASLQEFFHTMDRAADGGASDGYLTAENFSHIRKRAQFLRRLRTSGKEQNLRKYYQRLKQVGANR